MCSICLESPPFGTSAREIHLAYPQHAGSSLLGEIKGVAEHDICTWGEVIPAGDKEARLHTGDFGRHGYARKRL